MSHRRLQTVYALRSVTQLPENFEMCFLDHHSITYYTVLVLWLYLLRCRRTVRCQNNELARNWHCAALFNWLGLMVGGHPALSLHSSNEPGELSQ